MSPSAFRYRNRLGDEYYLHEGRTKTGKPRFYFARSQRAGALATMPCGFEVAESINGVVSVRRLRPHEEAVADTDVARISSEVARHAHLGYHRVRVDHGEIVIYAPDPSPESLEELARALATPRSVRQFVAERMVRARYSAVMKFVPNAAGFDVHRMTYRGEGGWSWPLASGSIEALARTFVPAIGTERFFDLF